MLVDLPPLPLSARSPFLYIEKGRLEVIDTAFVLTDTNGVRAQIPIGNLTCLLLGPGTVITHDAVSLAAKVRCLLIWAGEHGVRLYSAGQVDCYRSDRLLAQVQSFLDPVARQRIVYKMFAIRFHDDVSDLSIEQIRGKEAVRVKNIYSQLAVEYGVNWHGRRYDPHNWRAADCINRCLNAANSCLYSITEAAVLIAGYSPNIGFVHGRRPRSFVFDMADLVKFDSVTPIAFATAADNVPNCEQEVRIRCRDYFRKDNTAGQIIPLINALFAGTKIENNGVVEPPAFSAGANTADDGPADR